MSYRENAPPAPDPPDLEHTAIAEIARRTRRLRGGVVVASFFIGLVGTGAVFNAFESYYAARNRGMPIKMALIASFTLALVPALLIGPRLTNGIVRAMKPRWLDATAKKYGLDRKELEEMTASF